MNAISRFSQTLLFLCLLVIPFHLSAQEWNAADTVFGVNEMKRVRQELFQSHGNQINYLAIAERLEFLSGEGDEAALAEIQGWIGTDADRFWIKSDTEYSFTENSFEEFELQSLYSKPISPFFDLQAGVRFDTYPGPDQVFGVVALQGLAQYWFEVDLSYFLSEHGKSSFRGEFEYDLLLTQQLILQPRAELNFAIEDDPERGVGSGLSTTEFGIRLRYEIEREISPYIGISWIQEAGNSADFSRIQGDEINIVAFVGGIRLWF